MTAETVSANRVRVLVTGSRDWEDRDAINTHLDAIRDGHPRFILVTGACPSGADRMAEEWAHSNSIQVELHPAEWGRHGRAAGPIRNQEMVDSAPDRCVAFVRANSAGATGTVRMCLEAGIRTDVFTAI